MVGTCLVASVQFLMAYEDSPNFSRVKVAHEKAGLGSDRSRIFALHDTRNNERRPWSMLRVLDKVQIDGCCVLHTSLVTSIDQCFGSAKDLR